MQKNMLREPKLQKGGGRIQKHLIFQSENNLCVLSKSTVLALN